MRISPAGILDPLWSGKCRGRAKYETRDDHHKYQFHGTPPASSILAPLSDQFPPIFLGSQTAAQGRELILGEGHLAATALGRYLAAHSSTLQHNLDELAELGRCTTAKSVRAVPV